MQIGIEIGRGIVLRHESAGVTITQNGTADKIAFKGPRHLCKAARNSELSQPCRSGLWKLAAR